MVSSTASDNFIFVVTRWRSFQEMLATGEVFVQKNNIRSWFTQLCTKTLISWKTNRPEFFGFRAGLRFPTHFSKTQREGCSSALHNWQCSSDTLEKSGAGFFPLQRFDNAQTRFRIIDNLCDLTSNLPKQEGRQNKSDESAVSFRDTVHSTYNPFNPQDTASQLQHWDQ